ncbi:hypothetical protein ABIB67_008364 [Bradyrhizobium sp. F1.2.1]
MPAERLPMRKIREVLRLKYACGVSDRVISRSVGIGRTAIAEYVRRAAVIGITWLSRRSSTTQPWSASCLRRPATTRHDRSRFRIGGMSMPSCAAAA